MAVKRKMPKLLRRLLSSRRGTAEIVGSIMFLLIIMFFFTNVFLWHDNATREMDGVLAERMNSPISVQVVNRNVTQGLHLNVTNNGGVGVELSRLWKIANLFGGVESHEYVDLDVWVAAGKTVDLPLLHGSDVDYIGYPYTFTVVTTRGNMASCSCVPLD